MDFSEFEKQYLSSLNAQQREAVLTVDGPVLLLATPGSGKTTVLVLRIGYMLLCLGIDPRQILTMTYTRAAVRDMRSRFVSFFGEALSRGLQFRTINGVSSRIIAHAARRYDRSPFSLMEDGERSRLLREVYLCVIGEYPDESTIRDLSTAITYIKNMMLTDEDVSRLKSPVSKLSELYRQYQAELRARRLMDYDDQLVYTLRLLQRSPDLLRDLQRQYRYYCVDEAQDISRVQHEIIRHLASGEENLFMVGDEDQSIYGFRAAYPDALMHFKTEHCGARLLLIEQNYRSTREIIQAANRYISENRCRHPKTIVPTRGSGLPVRIISVSNRAAQYRYIYQHAAGWNSGTAVLFRNNDSALPLIDHFDRDGISFSCRNFEDSFFTHRVVCDIQDILRLSAAPDNAELFLRVYYKFGVPVSRSAAMQAVSLGAGSGRNLFQVLRSIRELNPAARQELSRLALILWKLRTDSAVHALEHIWDDMGYGRYVEQNSLESGKRFILSLLAEDVSAAEYLPKLQRLRNLLASQSGSEQGIILSTIHSAKGLEYDSVLLLDMLDGILPTVPFPMVKTAQQQGVYEEERRLFYVAMTRAKNELSIFLPQEGASFPTELSRYLPADSQEPGEKNLLYRKALSMSRRKT